MLPSPTGMPAVARPATAAGDDVLPDDTQERAAHRREPPRKLRELGGGEQVRLPKLAYTTEPGSCASSHARHSVSCFHMLRSSVEPHHPLARSSAIRGSAGVGQGRERGVGGAPPWSSQRRRLELPARRLKLEGEGGPARWLSRGGGAPPTPRSARTHTQHWLYRRRPSARAGWLRRASPAAASRVRGPPRQCQHTRTAARASCSSPASLHIGCACCV